MARIGIEVGIFDKLSKGQQKIWSSKDLAKACEVDPPLMGKRPSIKTHSQSYLTCSSTHDALLCFLPYGERGWRGSI
jgi:hypothetical protein